MDPSDAARSKRVVYIVTSSLTARVLLRGQLAFLRRRGYEVALICSPSDELGPIAVREGVEVIGVSMEREIRPLRDALALVRLTRRLRSLRPAIVNASTPKAGLLGMIAARIARVPVRLYVVRGLRLETLRGGRRALLAAAEHVASACASQVLCVSRSLRDAYRQGGYAPRRGIGVLGDGSSNGVNVERFDRARGGDATARLRARLDLDSGPVVGFVGRLTRDKGVVDLLAAFDEVRVVQPAVQLLLVGPLEAGDPLPADLLDRLRRDSRVRLVGPVEETAPYYGLMDVLAFPSYREGFPNAPLEAAASGVPAVGYRVTGTVDAVVDGVTGTLVGRGDIRSFAAALVRYLCDDDLRTAHGTAARERVRTRFSNQVVWTALAAYYDGLVG
jgi:glycosyltransferase involved in cell wall biosynthesis